MHGINNLETHEGKVSLRALETGDGKISLRALLNTRPN
jgi:hypothetical protein